VQIATAIAKQCPYLLEGDVMSLSRDFTLHAGKQTLEDTSLGIHHPVQVQAHEVVQALTTGVPVATLRTLAAGRQIQDLQLTELLGFLNVVGGLQRRRSVRAWPMALARQLTHSLLGVRYSLASWRRPATPTYILFGVVRASLPLIIATVLVAALMAASGLVPVVGVMVGAVFGLSTFLSSVLLHEMAHTKLIQKNGQQAAVLQRGMRLGIVHRTLSPELDIRSALAGPAVGLATGLIIGVVGFVHSPVLGLLGCVIGLFHLGGLLPWYGDGASLRRAMRQRKVKS
jgi:hypothetical protein